MSGTTRRIIRSCTYDPFHVVSWVTDALDEVRRDVWNASRHSGNKALAGELKGARYALWKNPENLSSDQRFRLAIVAKINHPLYKAYLLKEQLQPARRWPSSTHGWPGRHAAGWPRSWRRPRRLERTGVPLRRRWSRGVPEKGGPSVHETPSELAPGVEQVFLPSSAPFMAASGPGIDQEAVLGWSRTS